MSYGGQPMWTMKEWPVTNNMSAKSENNVEQKGVFNLEKVENHFDKIYNLHSDQVVHLSDIKLLLIILLVVALVVS